MMKIAISTAYISPGSGLSQYVLTLAKLLSCKYHVLVMTTHGKDLEYEKQSVQMNGNIEYYSVGQYWKIKKYIQTISLLRHWRPDVLINNYDATIQFVLPLLRGRTTNINIIHSNIVDFYRIGAINGKYVMGWIAPTSGVAAEFNDYTRGKYLTQIKVIPHGVKRGMPPMRKDEPLCLCFIGSIDTHKGIAALPPIIHSLRERGVVFQFTIAGDGPLRDYLNNELKQEIDDNIVKIIGCVPHEKIYEYLCRSHIFVYPTHCDAFGLVIAEAMANGSVPIVTHLQGITDNLVDNGINGFLVEKDNIDAFVNMICLLNENRNKLEIMSNEAIKKSRKEFSEEMMQQRYEDFIAKTSNIKAKMSDELSTES